MSQAYDRSNYKKGFWYLIATLFQGAFSDNFFKFTLIFIFLAQHKDDLEFSSEVGAYAAMLFAIPFIIFPGFFGAFADRVSKKRIITTTKYLELIIMTIGGFAILSGNPTFLWGMLFLMATQSAMFGPAKYGILPEALPESKLSWGNGIMQMMTMVAIIAGVGAAGPVAQFLGARDQLHYASIILIALAVLGITTSHKVFAPPAADPERAIPINPWSGMGKVLKIYAADKWLWLSVIAYVYFWFAGALLQANLIPYGNNLLGLNETQMAMQAVALSLGIGVGAASAGFLSRGKIEVGLIPLGALGMSVFAFLLAIPSVTFAISLLLLTGLGVFGGIFDVPLAATIQHRSPAHARGAIMAVTNMFTFIGMFTAGALMLYFGRLGISPLTIFLIIGVLTLCVGLYIVAILPIFFLRFILWVLANTLYRMRVVDASNVPEKGGALLIANHTSFVDALIITASLDRPVRGLMYKGIYDLWWVKPIAKAAGIIPLMPGSDPAKIKESLQAATDALKNGELIVIFAEGQITRTGQLLPFRKGFEKIVEDTDVPIIPIHIDQIWGSIFSFSGEKFFWKLPKKIPFPITVVYGAPMPPTTSAFDLRCAIQELGTNAYQHRTQRELLLHELFIKRARRHPFQRAIADARSGQLNNLKALVGAIILARKLKPMLDADEKMIGILLPQSIGGTLANIAITFLNRIPINLNYTTSDEALDSAATQCEMRHVISAKAFLEQVPVTPPRDLIMVDDIMASVQSKDRIQAMLMALFLPRKTLLRILGGPEKRNIDDLATVVFSSGSEGDPKGVMLTHYNITKNIESALQVFPHKKGDCVMGMLPFFHVFGYTATLWLPLVHGNFSAVYHPNPMEAREIGKLIEKHKATIMFSTSTFLHGFIRRCTASQLSTIQFLICGAEKLSPRVRDAFLEKFGVEPLEGYGTTECAPIVSLNVPDFRAPGFFQRGTKRGSIGHPLPGISVRITDPDTGDLLKTGEAGLLWVKGPNVMQGYLNMPEKTAAVLKDGWYETGDIATIDEDGFITITDRLARFSKIGGEMVSHTKVEEELLSIVDTTERVIAVTGVLGDDRGESLIVLHTLEDPDYENLIGRLKDINLPNLWIPKQNAFYKVDEIPILGTGKLDIKGVRTLAKNIESGS